MRFKDIDYWILATRMSGILLIIISIAQFIFFIYNRNLQYPIFGTIFVGAIFLTVVSTIISVANSWYYSKPKLYKVLPGYEPTVGVIIPTCGEPIDMILNTIASVLSQDWPEDKLVIVISDDGRDNLLKREVKKISRNHPSVEYYLPPDKKSKLRQGTAKAGNLNAALKHLIKLHPDIEFIETRDADDLVGSSDFLRISVGSLLADEKISFVQSIKRALVSKGDPFLNQEILFYERTMRYRDAVNAIFPCGSGLVWRISELHKIKGFPTWNLVEDLHSGFECLKLGGKGQYLPFVGAIGQSAPEDIPNYYKQRGTWAIDSLRLFFWKNPIFAKKLTLWQKLQFIELGFSYILSLVIIFFIFSITSCLGYAVCPTDNQSLDLFIVSGLFVVILELYNISRARGAPYQEIWKARQTWIGLLHVFSISVFKALLYGPNKKPTYKITRKDIKIGFYLREIAVQCLFFSALVFSLTRKLLNFEMLELTDSILIFWTCFILYCLSRVISNSTYGVSLKFNFRTKVNPGLKAA